MNKKRMSLKQFFTTILLSLAMFVIYFISIMPVFASLQLSIVLYAGITGLLCGPIYVLMIAKSRVPGTLFITSALFALFYLIVGQIPLVILMLAVGVISELILMKGGYQSQNRQLIPYILLWVAIGMKNIFMYGLFSSAVLDAFVRNGMDLATAQLTMDSLAVTILSVPLNLAGVAVTIIGCAIGYFIGKKAMRKYFAPAGVASSHA